MEHLGRGVYVQYNKCVLNADAREVNPVTITREEIRSVLYHALDALKACFKICVIGQPGIGKTRASMMYAIHALLFQLVSVLYVGYK